MRHRVRTDDAPRREARHIDIQVYLHVDIDDAVHARVAGACVDYRGSIVIQAVQHQVGTRRASNGGLRFVHDGGHDPRARPLCQEDGGGANHARPALHQHILALDITIGEETAMGRQRRNAQGCPDVERRVVG
ncbi:hypothetical protein D3C71_1580910 [compost metagenome]